MNHSSFNIATDHISIPVNYIEVDPLFNSSIARGIVTLCVSAPAPNTGVSTVAYSLAKRSAASGKTTLLVDANIHNPCVAQRLGINHIWDGMLDSVDDAIYHCHDIKLSILPGIDRPVVPLHLRDKHGLQQWCEHLKAHFEVIIFDCEPICMPTSHGIPAALLSSICDGNLMVVQAGCTTQEDLMFAAQILKESQAVMLGCVMNRQHYSGFAHTLETALSSKRRIKIMEALCTKLISKLRRIETTL